jgi:F0F1-type ATP synthase delta subunit
MPPKLSTLTKKLVDSSINDQGLVDETLVVGVLDGLNECKPPKHLDILKNYLSEIERKLRFQTVEIELGSDLSDAVTKVIKDKINSLSSRSIEFKVSINSELIAGYKAQVVDDVFEDSVQSRLSKLSQSFTS